MCPVSYTHLEYALPDLKAAAQEWLDTMEDGKLNSAAADKYIAALENGVLTVEEGIAFLESAEGKAKFGDNAASMLEHMKSLKAAGKMCIRDRPDSAAEGALAA